MPLARDHHAKLVLVTVVVPPQPTMAYLSEVPSVAEAEIVEGRDQARRHLMPVASRIVDLPVETKVLSGSPGACIVAAAQDGNADLIVMGTHGRTGVSRLLMGSVAEYVLRHAQCPVLTIKPGTSHHLGHDEATALTASRPVGMTIAQSN